MPAAAVVRTHGTTRSAMTDQTNPDDPNVMQDEPTTERVPSSGTQVPLIATPIGELELAAVLRDAYTHVCGEPPTVACLTVAWAQCALEHGHGKATWCHNIGNVTAFRWSGNYYVITFSRKANPHDAPAGDAPTFHMRFRAHDDFIDGARDYWRQLTTTFARAMPAFEAGDARGAAHALKAARYFTAPEQPYANTMASLAKYFAEHVLPQL